MTRRAFTLVGALSFLLSTAGEGFGLFPCPYHEALHGAEADAGADRLGDPHEHHGQHGHDRTSSPSGHFGHSHETDTGPDLCTHFEACQNTAGSVLAGLQGAGGVATYTTPDAPVAAPAARFSVLLLPFFLPYPNAPPALG